MLPCLHATLVPKLEARAQLAQANAFSVRLRALLPGCSFAQRCAHAVGPSTLTSASSCTVLAHHQGLKPAARRPKTDPTQLNTGVSGNSGKQLKLAECVVF